MFTKSSAAVLAPLYNPQLGQVTSPVHLPASRQTRPGGTASDCRLDSRRYSFVPLTLVPRLVRL
jgi:hypothetical protein